MTQPLRFVLVACLMLITTVQGGGGGGTTVGYWWWSWQPSGSPPGGTNLGVAFSGYADPDLALSNSQPLYDKLPGMKFLDIGGGDNAGKWTSSQLQKVTRYINESKFNAYQGIAYDVEIGDAGLTGLFLDSFRAAKMHGFKVLVTVSGSAPYSVPDAPAMMSAFFNDGNVDYLSPQLYVTGDESKNNYGTNAGVSWDQWKQSRASVVPSIVTASLYSSAVEYFQGHGVTLQGWLQWKQG